MMVSRILATRQVCDPTEEVAHPRELQDDINSRSVMKPEYPPPFDTDHKRLRDPFLIFLFLVKLDIL